MLADLVGKFSGHLTYSEFPSLSPELATYILSLSVLTGCLGVAVGPPVGRAWFEFFCRYPIAAGVAVSGGGSLSEPVGREGSAGAGR